MIPKIPANMANQTVTLRLKTGNADKWGHEQLDTVNVNHCVVQPQTVYSGTNNDRQIVANAIVFFYTGITNPLPRLTKKLIGSKLIFEDEEYTITTIVDNRDPYSDEVWSYELEVM